MSARISEQPGYEAVREYVQAVLRERGGDIAFLVLFGSRVRGNWTAGSDWDVLVGLSIDDGLRFLDRLAQFDRWARGAIQVFAYARSEWSAMARDFHLLFLEALDGGVALFDAGPWAELRREVDRWLAQGVLKRQGAGWQICDSSR